MAKKIYVGVNNIAKNVSKIYVGVNNIAKKVTKGYIGVNGVAQKFYEAIPQLNYIQSTGTQYIKTFYKPKTDSIFKFKIMLTGTAGDIDYERIIWAGSGSSTSNNFQRANRTTSWNYFLGTSSKWSGTLNQNEDYTFDIGSDHFTINGVTTSFSSYTYTSNYNMEIFHGNDRYGKFKLYYFQIYEGTTLVKNFIPVLNGTTPCLLETVSNTYYNNAGYGTFLYG